MISDTWQGTVQFWELVFGTWLVYGFLVLMWERVLREPLEEWRYVMITFLGASFYWINHYFQHAPFYLWLLNGYTLVVWVAYYRIGVRERGSLLWTVFATLSFPVFTVAFIGFEQAARFAMRRWDLHEFWFMLVSYFGFLGLILWRGSASQNRHSATET
jgi:hypothetical protein